MASTWYEHQFLRRIFLSGRERCDDDGGPRPSCREDFEVAIICALPLEYNEVAFLFDEFWDRNEDLFGRAVRDPNPYTTGRIGKLNVVLALLSHMGKANAAAARPACGGALRLGLLAGICGGASRYGQDDMLLGDVVMSKTFVQYDCTIRLWQEIPPWVYAQEHGQR